MSEDDQAFFAKALGTSSHIDHVTFNATYYQTAGESGVLRNLRAHLAL